MNILALQSDGGLCTQFGEFRHFRLYRIPNANAVITFCNLTTIRLRSNYDISRAPASIRREQKIEHVNNFSS